MSCCGGKMTIRKVAHGAVGLFKAVAQVDKPAVYEIERRMDLCRTCDRNRAWFCAECNCLILAKVRNKDEFCCLKKW